MLLSVCVGNDQQQEHIASPIMCDAAHHTGQLAHHLEGDDLLLVVAKEAGMEANEVLAYV